MKIPENTQMDADYWRDVQRAMQMTPQERVRIGHELFERAIYLMTQGLKMQHPEQGEDGIRDLRREKLRRIHQWESRSAQIGGDSQAGVSLTQ